MTPERFRCILTRQDSSFSAFAFRLLFEGIRPFYALGVWWRNRRFERKPKCIFHADQPVISIGNLTLGGTGKTPTVLWVARELEAFGLKVAILSRGYRASEQQKLRETAVQESAPRELEFLDGFLPLNDEGLEMAERLPEVLFFQNPDRCASARRASMNGADVLVLDDGFQHRKLARDGDVVLVDADEPFGLTGRLFPCGTLREPMRGLARADVVILTHADRLNVRERHSLREELATRFPSEHERIWVEAVHRPAGFRNATGKILSGDELRDSLESATAGSPRFGAFCGIGKPEGFVRSLRDCGLEIQEMKVFPDHQPYDDAVCAELVDWARTKNLNAVFCTEKDRVKLPAGLTERVTIFSLQIEMSFLEGEKEFRNWLHQTVQNARIDLLQKRKTGQNL